jgi:branched-chain amino acid aminotransferase
MHTATMMNGVNRHSNGHANGVETASHLIENGFTAAKEVQEQQAMQDLDVSKLKVTIMKSPGKVLKPDSVEIWDMKTCTDHSTCPSLKINLNCNP